MKVFFGEKTFYLVDNADFLASDKHRKVIHVESLDKLKKEYENAVKDAKKNEIIFIHKDVAVLKEKFESFFTIVAAAGGLVVNEKSEYLFIFRKGKWDLPKGKIEKNETIEVAAIREVEEECGISGLSIIKPIPTTYHIYIQKGVSILKPTYWFEMKTVYNGKLIPQEQEGITKVEWVKKENVAALLPNAYESIREVMQNYISF